MDQKQLLIWFSHMLIFTMLFFNANKYVTRVTSKVGSLEAKLLSRADRFMMIKLVLNSLPLYYLSIFKIPKGVVNRIIQMRRKLFWLGSGGKAYP